jgi:hypothetical protein
LIGESRSRAVGERLEEQVGRQQNAETRGGRIMPSLLETEPAPHPRFPGRPSRVVGLVVIAVQVQEAVDEEPLDLS